MYVVPKRLVTQSEFSYGSGIFSQGKDRQPETEISEVSGAEESSSNFFFNIESVLKSMNAICMSFGIFVIFFSLVGMVS